MLPPVAREPESQSGGVTTSPFADPTRTNFHLIAFVIAFLVVAVMFTPFSKVPNSSPDSSAPIGSEMPIDGIIPEPTISELLGSNSYVVSTGNDVPECNSQTHGQLYYIVSEDQFRTCQSYGEIYDWLPIEIKGEDGQPGQDGSSPIFNKTTSTNCMYDGSKVNVGIDHNNNGILDSDEVIQSFEVCNGQDGVDGQDGDAGNSTAILNSIEPSGPNCESGGIRIDVGIDYNSDGELQVSEIDQTQYLCNGNDGSSSPNTMLTRISPTSGDLNCTVVGRVVENGLDNGENGGIAQNGILEDGEVDYGITYCDRFIFQRLTDINPDGNSTDIVTKRQVVIGSTMYFEANDGTNGRELWAYDFDNSSSWMVADINPGSSHSGPDEFTVIGTRLYFSASDGINGEELWAYETTNTTIWLILDINPDGYSDPQSLTVLNSSIYFIALSESNGYCLWEHDTTNGSTWKISSDVNFWNAGYTNSVNKFFSRITVYDNHLYVTDFNGTLHAYSPINSSLWQVSPSGSPMVFNNAFSLQTVGDQVIIRTALTNDLTGRNSELWIYSPMNDSSWKLPIQIHKNSNADRVDPSLVHRGELYFWNYSNLYIYNSQNSTVWPVTFTVDETILTRQRQIGFIGDLMFFGANSASGPIYVHNFANSTTWEVVNFSGNWDFMAYDDSLIFSATGDYSGAEYWRLQIERTITFH